MDIPKRLEQSLTKLYNAFHNNTLNPECCSACAVGNILDNHYSWKYLSDEHGSLKLSYVGKIHQQLNKKFNGYSPKELLQIEKIFLEACGFKTPLCHYNPKPINPRSKETLFKGLSVVVAYLCKLDNVVNVMDYSRIFEYDNENPKYKLDVIYS